MYYRGHDRSMTTKIAVSLPDEQVERARRAVAEGRAASVSAYISEALAQMPQEGSLEALLDELDRELGPPTAEDYAWADRMLGLA